MRIGHGYDVHKLVPDRALILGGCKIDFALGLMGHSDADVLVHSIMDALLGAAAEPDIGVIFPDSDNSFKNANSLVLLKKVCKRIYSRGYNISNIDSTIILQKPKIKNYIEAIRKNIATVCNLPFSAINVKATTEEGLGFTGHLRGIAVHTVALLTEKDKS